MTDVEWNIQNVLNWTTQHFTTKQIPSPRVDAEVLLSHILKCKRLDLYLKFDQPMTDQERSDFKELVRRRTTFEPVAYILGEKDFFGRTFRVGPGVLVPRPETEHIIDEALGWAKSRSKEINVLDVATGSGILAATLAAEISLINQVTAVDISVEALKFAQTNFENLGVAQKISIVCEDFVSWAKSSTGKFDLITANPPYIAQNFELMKDVKDFEPALALYGGEKGSEILLKWIPLMIEKLNPQGLLLCEIGFDQKKIVEESLPEQGISLSFIKDYGGSDRVIKIIKV